MKLRVCFFNSCRAWGGGEKWHLDAASALTERGYAVCVAADRKGRLLQKVVEKGMQGLPVRIGNLSALNPLKLWRLIRLFRRLQLDAIILNLPSDLKVAGAAARLAGIRKVVYRRGSAIPIRNTLLNRMLFKHVITHVIANSRQTKQTILQNNADLFPEAQIRVIYNGIDFPSDDQAGVEKPSGTFTIGTAGRLSREKNQAALIDLAVELKRREIDFRVRIAGEGVLREALEESSRTLGVSESVDFFGFVEDIDAFMASLDLFVLTSEWEGFGYVLVEAMKAGTPVLAFDVSCIPEIVSDGKNGYLVPFGDIDFLADKVVELHQDKEKREALGDYAKNDVRIRFNRTESMDQLENLLTGVDGQ